MRKTLIALSALGMGAATLTGTSIYAPSGDSSTLGRFDVSSGTFTNPVNILVAQKEQGGVCGTFVDAPSLKVDVTMPEGDDESEVVLGDYCVKNNGRVPIDIGYQFFVIESTETECSVGEADAGDSTCGEGPGEIEFTTYLGYRTLSSASGGLTNASRNKTFARAIAPGDVVPVKIFLQWSDMYMSRANGQSDFLRLDGRFDAVAS